MRIRGYCKRQNTCYDCDSKTCNGAGDKGADCSKYHCDNDVLQDCEHCEFIDGFIEKEGKRFGKR